MFRYRIFSLSVQSEVELSGLRASASDPDVVIRLGPVRPSGWRASPVEEVAFNETQVGRFRILNGREIVLDRKPGADPEIVQAMLIGRVMAYLLRQRGWLPLHGSAVLIGGQAVLFVGDSGAGKSTTAAAFHACGYPVLTDEVGAVRVLDKVCHLRTSGTRLRLNADSLAVIGNASQPVRQNGKHALPVADDALPDDLPLSRIYALDYGPEFAFEPVPPVRAVQLLSLNSFIGRRGMMPEVAAAHTRSCIAVAAAAPVQRLIRRKALDALPQLVELVAREAISR